MDGLWQAGRCSCAVCMITDQAVSVFYCVHFSIRKTNRTDISARQVMVIVINIQTLDLLDIHYLFNLYLEYSLFY